MANLELLTYNIYGLQPAYLHERTDYICKYILEQYPSVIFLQEVVHNTWPTITSQLGANYHCFCGQPKAHYFPALLVKRDDKIKCNKETVIDFPTSGQGRYLISVPITCNGKDIILLSSHIESMDEKHHVQERKSQLKTAFNKMEELIKKGDIAIFGGDMNTFDAEISNVGLPTSVQDVWVYLGSDRKKCKTWNTKFPVNRPDRVYFGPTDGPVCPTTFDLIGKDIISHFGCHPSDHYGILINFAMKE